jgi:hypothetical protein
MVAGAAKINNNTTAMAIHSSVRSQLAPVVCPGSFGWTLGATDGSAPGEASLSVEFDVGLAEGSEPAEPSF